jgi:parvulin-like peptidyl-prolyl isomerase
MRTLTLSLIVFLFSCSYSSTDPKSEIIAKVNGEAIPLSDFLVGFNQMKADQDDILKTNPKLLEQLKYRALNEAVITCLIRQEAGKKQIRIAKEEIEGRLSNWKDGYPPGGYEEMLKTRNTTEYFLKKRIGEQLHVEKITETLFGTETMVSDEEMRNYYKEHQNDLTQPLRVHALQIVVPTIEEAEKIRQEILSDQITFESAARKYSLSPDAAKGGDLGFFAKNEKIAAFNKAFSLVVGSVSSPIQSRYGYHLLKVLEKQASKKLAFNEAREEITKSLKKLKEVKIYKEWVTKLVKDAEIYQNEALFNSISS